MGERSQKPLMMTVTELQFADDAALVGASRDEMERAARIQDEVASEWGLTISLPKIKLLVRGVGMIYSQLSSEMTPTEAVSEFKYLGRGTWRSPERCLGLPMHQVFFCADHFWCRPVFQDNNQSLKTRRKWYRAMALRVLLYGAEAWVNKRVATRKLESFNNSSALATSPVLK